MASALTLDWGDTWPTNAEFVELGRTHRVVPVARKLLGDGWTPVAVYAALAQSRPGTFILESAQPDGTRSRYSFVGVRSQAALTVVGDTARWAGEVPDGLEDGAPLEAIAQALEVLASEHIAGLPPLTGGLVGALGWDLVRQWEPTLPADATRELDLPDAHLLLATDLAVLDHVDGSVWLVANAVNTDAQPTGIDAAYAAAVARVDTMERALAVAPRLPAMAIDAETPEGAVSPRSQVGEYEKMVKYAKEAIRDGEVFQVVPSQRFDAECGASALDVYRVLRTLNPSPYMYYVECEDADGRSFAIVGASPESLVTVKDRSVLTYPIAGSRPRGATPEADKALEAELLADPKEVAEHVMLVDLSRNDLVKVCVPTSVEVVEFMAVNRYSHIMHICSTVVGVLEEHASALDAFVATFPAGTLSGAPKPRAIALIDELEPVRRGFYGGAVGYFDFAGNMDLAIAIRTAVIQSGVAHVQAGAGVVADSVPATEAQETRDKAAAMLRAVARANRLVASCSG
ncbi:anthranilate synthase component I [Demequina sp. TTPB684]|uniref:anthranilate synthase component I n=1 Tax=unclassified Demequina TaxID=2620311 RepID=UPI001CF4623E|nr:MULTISPECIES: anthranilate synthase component I [unclassified Demequina]MCB2413932.1 anthranilate synthase component I [Demequina sp. TTPB684]UPU89707.1 anthranilate synthase component I [Demequina sp. TMPB413]